jgi:hypothetical protein
MPKWLIFFYRYITAPYRLRKWFNIQTVVVFILSASFFTALAWTSPANRPHFMQGSGQVLNTPIPTTVSDVPPRAATLSPEYLANSEQTVGITLYGAVLVIIVLLGVLIFLPRHDG